MKIKGVLFDKDGTLLDFTPTWEPIAKESIITILNHYDLDLKYMTQMMEKIGFKDGEIAPDGSISWGTNRDVAKDFKAVLGDLIPVDFETFLEFSTKTFNKNVQEKPFFPVNNMKEIISLLFDKGIHIGLSTADTVENANFFLDKTDVLEYFKYIGADDGVINPKPAPDYMLNFCKNLKINPEEVCVIGDTKADMDFGLNSGAGMIIGVLTGSGTIKTFENSANIVLNSIEDLYNKENKTLVWEELNG